MTRAQEASLKAYPKAENKVWSSAFGTFEFDENGGRREGFIKGYEQAEEDLALTVEDIATIHSIIGEVAGCPIKYDEEYYEEILRRFNKNRKK